MLAEFGGKSALLTGDGFAAAITAGLVRRLGQPGDRLPVTVTKLAHHGSRNNTSLRMLERLDCARFLVSTSGAIFGHPDVEAIARAVVANGPGVDLGFSYRSKTTEAWDDPTIQGDPEYPFTNALPGRGRRRVADRAVTGVPRRDARVTGVS